MKRILTLALLLALCLMLLRVSGAMAASETMVYTISDRGKAGNWYWLEGSDGSSYNIGDDYMGGKTYTAAMGDVTITITSTNSYCHIGRHNKSYIYGFDLYNYTFTFSSATRYISNVKIKDVYKGTELSVENNTRECTVSWDHNAYGDAQQFEVTLSDTKPVSTYNIAYELNGGVNAASNPATYNDDATTALAAPVRTGYSFGGWYDNEGLTGSPVTGIPAGSSGDKTFYAKWTINAYTLRFDAFGGSAVAPITLDYGAALTAPAAPTRTGYTFSGWHPALPDTMPAANYVFSALWTPIQYRVSFDANGGAGSMGSYNLTYGQTSYLTYNAFARKGYSFAGWNTAADGSGTAYQDGQSVSSLTAENGATVTLYAQWTVNQYTMTFDSNGGSAVAPIVQDYGTALTAPADPTRTGYRFYMWFPTLPGTIPAENRWFKALWAANSYMLTFDSNGGTGEAMSYRFKYDQTEPLPANTYTRTGYAFAGWNTKADGSGTAYQDGQEVVSLTAENEAIVKLYAQWRPITYAVHFEPGIPVNGEMADQSLTYDQAANLTANGFSTTIGDFVSWNTEPDGDGTEYADQAEALNLTAVEGDTVTLYAQWHLSHHIHYDLDVFSCDVNGNERQHYWAYEGDTVTVSIVDHSREYTVSVVSASGSDLDFDADAMTFTMPNEAVFITYESLNKMAYTNILLDNQDTYDVVYLYDADHPTVTPVVTVQDYNGNPLTAGVDYTLEITGNTGSASRLVTATVTVTGMGGYIGVNEKTFRITPFNIADCAIGGRLETYDDGYGPYYPLTRNVQVRSGAKLLTYDEDYTIELDSDLGPYDYEPGQTYTATVYGRGDWGGRQTFSFLMTELYHTVVFDANGGTGAMADDIVTKQYTGYVYTLPACGFTAPEGMTFDHWIADCEPEAEKQPGNYFTAPYIWSEYDVQTVTVTAYWRELPRQAVNISDTAHGTVTADAQTAWAGKAVTLDIQPEAGYALDSLTVFAGMDAVTVTDNAFTMPDGAVQVTATFAPVDYSVTVTDNLGGVLTASAATAHVGDTVTLSLPNASYALEALTVMQGSTPVAVENNSFTMPAGNVQVNAVLRQRFEIVEQWSGMSHSDIMLISGYVDDGGFYANAGDTVTFRVMPEPGYDTVSSVRVTGDEERSVAVTDLGGNLYSFVMPDFDVFLYAECTNIRVEIPTGHGTVTVDPANPEAGDTVTLTVIPDAGYMAAEQEPYGWPVSIRTAYGEELYPQPFWDEETMEPVFNKYTFDMPSSGVTVTAAFEEAVYGINIVYSIDSGIYPFDEGGMDVTVNGETAGYSYPAKPGDAVALAVTPAPGYELVGITGNYLDYTGASQPVAITRDAANPLVWRFTMPDGWTHLEAAFRKLSLPAFGDPDFTMPAALKTIEESAFEGMPLLHVVDAGSVTAIGQGAFKDSGLQQIRLPKDCAIDADAFAGCGTVYVFAPAGGTTEAFCNSHSDVTFVDVPLTSTTEGSTVYQFPR